LLITQEVIDKFLCDFFEGWGVSLATNRSILVLIQIMIHI